MNKILEIPIPPLEDGDLLSRTEFERRYRNMPECKKAELIEGVVYMPSPVKFEGHGEPQAILIGFFINYVAATPGARTTDNSTNILDDDNEPQPDCQLFIHPHWGGKVQIEDDYIVGAPELVAEISGTTVALDRGPKLRTFLRNGVREYIVWRVKDRKIEWNVLRDKEYRHLQPDSKGILKSGVFPGLWLDVEAAINNDLAKVFAVLQQGIASPEHQKFVEVLKQKKKE